MIKKGKKTLLQKKKTGAHYPQNIDIDVHAPQDTNPPEEAYPRKFTQKMCQFKTDRPVILPLFKKLYCTPETVTDLCDDSVESNVNKPETGFMHTKLKQVLRTDPNTSRQESLWLLSFSDTEREHVESTTSKQWQCKEWYLQKASFITASKCKRVITCQETLKCRKVGRSYCIT